jgi:NAD-dependent SIR2 family protein deacetylase
LSTESGIPDYRGPETQRRARQPMRFAEFTAGEHNRRRYWARATLGYARVRDAQPNDGHRAIARAGVDVITQNVDGLHQKAGASRGARASLPVVELHGNLREVVCLGCGALCSRDDVHARLLAANPAFATSSAGAVGEARPDGDVDLRDDVIERFVVVDCERCGGALKPRVVFFGENVEAAVLAAAWRAFDAAQALLVVGSSLEVYSGRRFVMEAQMRAMPIVIVNATPTRADDAATVVVRGRTGAVLPALLR